jgi:hypothetical protein
MPRPSPYRADERLDDWIANPAVRTHHRRSAAASAEALWAAAREVRLADTRRLARLVRWRIPGVPEGQTFDELFRAYPFTLLDEGETWSVSGLCGRIWTLARDYPRLADAEEFRSWDVSGTVRVLFAHWAEAGEDGRATLVSEARVDPVDATARMRLRALWTVIGPFEPLVGAEPLAVAARRAEERTSTAAG